MRRPKIPAARRARHPRPATFPAVTEVLHPPTRHRLAQLLQRAGAARVVVVGDVMLDRYILGDVERISPEAPVPVLIVTGERDLPGGAANAAANVGAAGAAVSLVGTIGTDPAAASLRAALEAFGIGVDGLVEVPERPTTSKTRLVARGQQLVRIDREIGNPLAERDRDAMHRAARQALVSAGALLIEDYDKGALDAELAASLIGAARDAGIPVVVDPKRRNFFSYAGATVLKPNRRELNDALRTDFSGDEIDLDDARVRLGVDHLLVTRGADGLTLVSGGNPIRETPALAREVFDVAGAGDTVAAWAATMLAAGADMAEAAWIANLAAGVEVGKLGTATVSPAEMVDAWELAAGEQ